MAEQKPRAYQVELEITRAVTVIVSADSELEARQKANDLDYQHEIIGEITHWVVRSLSVVEN